MRTFVLVVALALSVPAMAGRLHPERWYQNRWCGEHGGAVEVAKLQGGDETDVDRLFEKYCSMVAFLPLPTASAEGETPAFSLWADTYLRAGQSAQERVKAAVLYDHYRHWARDAGERDWDISTKRWGGMMRNRYDFIKSGVIWYLVRLEGGV
ncbi:hypothetical protein [Pseudodesulfovibrio pelocollis]|uniref:hypothetical protein n=1 Tax=Pseudodesulfovibrio pelocollis TaxID=3051432 RepID=UPI00255B10CD|nr:hypothetical protein [Pseudodesulfovibrio sp. SB368]